MTTRNLSRYGMLAALVLLTAGGTAAVELQLEEEGASVSTDVTDDLLFLGESLDFSGTAESIYFLGRRLDLSGGAQEALLAMAQELEVSGTIGQDAVLAARRLELTGTFGSTTFAAGDSVDLSSGATVGGRFSPRAAA